MHANLGAWQSFALEKIVWGMMSTDTHHRHTHTHRETETSCPERKPKPHRQNSSMTSRMINCNSVPPWVWRRPGGRCPEHCLSHGCPQTGQAAGSAALSPCHGTRAGSPAGCLDMAGTHLHNNTQTVGSVSFQTRKDISHPGSGFLPDKVRNFTSWIKFPSRQG